LTTKRITHAVLDLGVVSELYPSSRTVLRVDVGTLLTRYGDATLISVPTPGQATIRSTGSIGAPWHIAVGAGYRLGRFQEGRERISSPPGRFAVGGQYSLLTLERSVRTVRDESGIGGWFDWNFKRYFAFDSSVTFFPRQVRFADFQQGGRIVQMLAGLRVGVQRHNFGVFGKFRPGVQIYTKTVQNETSAQLTRFADSAFDVGGIIEVYPSRHLVIRFDAGDTIIHYRGRSIIAPDRTPFQVGGFTNAAIQLVSGFGFRF